MAEARRREGEFRTPAGGGAAGRVRGDADDEELPWSSGPVAHADHVVTSFMTVTKLNTAVVVTVSQAAALAQVSEATIRREIAAGRLQASRIGRCVRITRAEF